MPSQLKIHAIIGPPGSGKSTLCGLLGHLAPRAFQVFDCSYCIERARRGDSSFGRMLAALRAAQDEGKILPGELVVQAVLQTLQEESSPLKHVVLCGSPRSQEEVFGWKRLQEEGSLRYRAQHIDCSTDEIRNGIRARIESGETRRDDDPRVVGERIAEYERVTTGCLNLLPEDMRAQPTARSRPLRVRLENVVRAMEIPESLQSQLLYALLVNERHPIHQRIRKIESGNHGSSVQNPVQVSGVLV